MVNLLSVRMLFRETNGIFMSLAVLQQAPLYRALIGISKFLELFVLKVINLFSLFFLHSHVFFTCVRRI